MNGLVKEWIAKAEGDFATACREHRIRKQPNYDAVCFHAQQCIEKYLKAVLQLNNIPFQKTHDLEILLQLCLDRYPLWQSMESNMELLTQYAIHFRYPGDSADRDEASQAFRAMQNCRDLICEVL